jgi:uncharacterized protein
MRVYEKLRFMPVLDSSLLLIVFAVTLGGFVQGMTGFGFGLVGTPLLALVMNVKDASYIVLGFSVFIAFLNVYSLRSQFDWKWKWKWDFVLALMAGVMTGVYIFTRVDVVILKHALGVVLIGLSITEFAFSKRISTGLVQKGGIPLGFCTGILGGSFNMGGPPAVVYAFSQPWKKIDMVLQLQLLFLISTLMRALFVGASDEIGTPLVKLFLCCLVPVFVGTYMGQRLFHKISQEKLRVIVFGMLALLGFKFMIWG